MKKIYLLLSAAIAISAGSSAQTIDNAGMETFRNSSSGGITIHMPTSWFGFDSLIISAEQTLVPAFLYPGYTPTDLHAQLFQETASGHVHGGTSSAMLVSVKQDTLGVFAGSLSNAQPSLNIASLIGGGSITQAVTYTGGTLTDLKVQTVSAWVQYFPGKDSVTHIFGGNDSGTVLVQALAFIGGVDSVIGTGTLNVGKDSSFTQVTANVVYVDNTDPVYKVRIIFSSGRLQGGLDSSIMYVDDVTMTGTAQPESVAGVAAQNKGINVYPNPAANTIYFDGAKAGQVCKLVAVNGQEVATATFTTGNTVSVANLAAGTYFYTISDANGNSVQKGKIAVSK